MKTKNNAGSIIIAVVALLTVLSAFVIAALSYTGTISYNVMATNTLRRATEVGDGSLQYMFAYWRELCKEEPTLARPTADFASIPTPSASLFPSIPNFTAQVAAYTGAPSGAPTIANYKVQATNPQGVPYDGVSQDVSGTVLATTTTPLVSNGINSVQNTVYYLASADVSLPAFAGRMMTVHLRQNFQKQTTSPWQYAIFYNDLLEINPGAPMSVAGWVHTNNYLYTAYDTLTFLNKVDYVDDWGEGSTTLANANGFAPNDADPNHVKTGESAPNYPTNLPPTRGDTQLPFGFDPSQVFPAGSTNANVADGYHELIEPPNADTSIPDPVAPYRYYDKADIRIMIGANNVVTMTDNAGNTINQAYATANPGTLNAALYNVFNSAISTGQQTLQDPREGATMNLTTLDVSQVTAALTPSSGTGSTRGGVSGTGTLLSSTTTTTVNGKTTTTTTNFTPIGVIYIANTTNSSSNRVGIELINGAAAPASGLTIVSENPIYVQGDYNTGQTSSSKTPANTANNGTGNNVVSGYSEASCAILADAINVLSNSWTNSESTNSEGSRVASPTTVNAAFVTGIVPTGSGGSGVNSYSGGAENFPRFLENWGSQTFTYYGSMVELYKSEQSTGYWGSNNVYNPPNRNWHFDTLFLTSPPPGTFTVINYAKGRWYTQ